MYTRSLVIVVIALSLFTEIEMARQCLPFEPMAMCLKNPCLDATCAKNPNAKCRVDFCGDDMCTAYFVDKNDEEVDC